MDFKELQKLYLEKKEKYGNNVFSKISEIFKEAKARHRKFFLESSVAKKAIKEGRTPDHEQSWRAFKGKNLEKLIVHIIADEVKALGLKIIEGKGRAIVEVDTDGGYVLSETKIEESNKVKMFDKFIEDLKKLLR